LAKNTTAKELQLTFNIVIFIYHKATKEKNMTNKSHTSHILQTIITHKLILYAYACAPRLLERKLQTMQCHCQQ